MIKYDLVIKNKTELLKQLESLKSDAIENMRAFFDDVFIKDVHALGIAINYIKECKK